MGVVGIDVGGTWIKGGVVDAAGALLTRRVANPRHEGPEAVVKTVLVTVDDLVGAAARRGCDVDAVGVATLGIVDEGEGIALWSSTVGWRDVPLGRLVAERSEAAVVVGHDVRAAAVAEATLGAGRGHRHVVFLPLGTGLSVAQVIDGHAVSGATWRAGEIGQLAVHGQRQEPWDEGCVAERWPDEGPVAEGWLEDGARLERVASAQALADRFARVTARSGEHSRVIAAGRPAASGGAPGPRPPRPHGDHIAAGLPAASGGAPVGPAGGLAVIEAAAGGDSVARLVLDGALGHLAEVLAAVVTVVDPSVVVVGGGLSLAGDTLLGPLGAHLAAALTWREPPPLLAAHFGDEAGWIGAAWLAWRRAGRAGDEFPLIGRVEQDRS